MADFHITSANNGTTLIRPITAKAEVFWKENNFFKYVVDNMAEHYVIKSVDSDHICQKIRENSMDFTA